MTTKTADVVICGAGIAGISVAWQLRTHPGDANDPEYLAKIESWDDTTQL